MVRGALAGMVVVALASTALAVPLSGVEATTIKSLLTASISAKTALTSSVRQAIQNVSSTEDAAAICAKYGVTLDLQALESFASNAKDNGPAALLLLQIVGVKPAKGQATTYGWALAVLSAAGVPVQGSPQAMVATVLNNPILQNNLIKLAQQPITPLTPRT